MTTLDWILILCLVAENSFILGVWLNSSGSIEIEKERDQRMVKGL